ncbi:MAG: hypothetical protein V4689_04755 [Verrucomicrobiota bacterium]
MSHVQKNTTVNIPLPGTLPNRRPAGEPRILPILADSANLSFDSEEVTDGHVILDGQPYLCIRNIDRMAPFLMNVVSDSDLWLFVASNTGFTAGRRDPDHAFFPYQTADKLLQQPKASGVCSLLEVDGELWEPWSPSTHTAEITRNLYKHATGSSVRFEEIHHRLQLRFCWTLASGATFGLIRSCQLENLGNARRQVRILDGWHQLLPPGVSQETYSRYSYLAAAYMRHEFLPDCGLGIFTLNSGISDRAEPCESLRVSVAWSLGLENPVVLLSDRQVGDFRNGREVTPEEEVRGEFGAYLVASRTEIAPGKSHNWFLAADGGLDHADVVRLRNRLTHRDGLRQELGDDIESGVKALQNRIAGADAIQQTADASASTHHFANSLFNCMRGGTLSNGYHFSRSDLTDYLKARNINVFRRHGDWLDTLPETDTLASLAIQVARLGDPQLARLTREYLPLSFSRRHGDPSRPWNRFEIRTKDRDGRPLHGYSGNWRDIFQNWESLAYSYPACFESMIAVFLSATTADGYNPYRITREGIDWEVHDPKDPWSHIGYWGDHQIIYLLRLLEGREHFHPGQLSGSLDERLYAYANVPYEIRCFSDLVRDPRHSIHFNDALHESLLEESKRIGGDGRLLAGDDGEVFLVPLIEKLLVPVFAKLSNLVPGGGIWLNTQRPEWNDANNALAGWGLSVVTVHYLRRYLKFLGGLLDSSELSSVEISTPVARLMESLAKTLPDAATATDDESRGRIMAALGRAGETHRQAVYQRNAFATTRVDLSAMREFVRIALLALDATIDANRRDDGMFHSYNLLAAENGRAAVRHLGVMLEGQVAALSSGRISPVDSLRLLDSLRQSNLYREDQKSYLLYADKPIVPFLDRNVLPGEWATRAPLLAKLAKAGIQSLVTVDDAQAAHFGADFTNARDLENQLDLLASDPEWAESVADGRGAVLELWEETFHHRAFTGRSGAMFAFEGLGSIYWHMVAKLLLAVQEVYLTEVFGDKESGHARRLADAYQEIRSGLGFTKQAKVYGAFPTDPYSHTPGHRGAQQPGMTGQVKEEILTRMGELGVRIREGGVHFEPTLLNHSEFFTKPHGFEYIGVDGSRQTWELAAGTLAFTLFQVPVCYTLSKLPSITVEWKNGNSDTFDGTVLPRNESRELFRRSDSILRLLVTIPEGPALK